MLMRTHQPPGARRRGVILIVVLSLLTLFAVLGLAFVLYADSSSLSSNIAKQGETQTQPDMDPEQALALFLGQFIYDVPDAPDPTTGAPSVVASALRGHSLARNMYGWYYPVSANVQSAPWPINDKAFNGTGRLHTGGTSGMTWPTMNFPGANAVDDYYLPNYTYFQADGFLRDPERYVAPGAAGRTKPSDPMTNSIYTGGFNPSYTYPDNNAFYLAAVKADGTLLAPSYHRFDATNGFGSLAATNPNWDPTLHPEGKYLTARLRPNEMGPNFPYPAEATGDVKNLFWGQGGADSIWVDIGAPVMVAADGRKYKMMVAPLILDLDNRVNLNVVGNILATNQTHASNQGWGPWEVNPAKVLNNAAALTEYRNLFLGSPAGAPAAAPAARVLGRYGYGRLPNSATPPAGSVGAHSYAPADYDALWNAGPNAGQVTGTGSGAFSPPSTAAPWYTAPGVGSAPPYSSFAFFDPTAYANGYPAEYNNAHPLRYNALRPYVGNRRFGDLETASLLRYGGTGADAMTGDLFRLLPTNLIAPPNATAAQALAAARARQMITTVSADLDRPGITPYIIDPNAAATAYAFTANLSYPVSAAATGIPLDMKTYRAATPAGSEFDPATWRSLAAALGRIDLNRIAYAQYRYPTPQANGTFLATDIAAPNGPFYIAQRARTQLAQDVFNALRQVTGAPPLVAPSAAVLGAPDMGFQANRWLAQLAVNLVDYIDDDDYSTPFVWNPVDPNFHPDPTNNPALVDPTLDARNFDPTLDPAKVGVNGRVVFGVEAPKVVLNEVYAQLENDPADAFPKNANAVQAASLPYRVNFWIELLNPMLNDGVPPNKTFFSPNGGGQALLQNSAAGYSPYSLWFTEPNTALDATTPTGVANVLGQPDGVVRAVVTDLGAKTDVDANGNAGQTVVLPVGTAFNGPTGPAKNAGFYLLGYSGKFNPLPGGASGADPNLTALLSYGTGAMSYPIPLADPNAAKAQTPTVLLRRLACPNLPPNPPLDPNNPGQFLSLNQAAPYNPYITVDRVDTTKAATPVVQDVRQYNGTTLINPPPPIAKRSSYGRRQPFQANSLVPQTLAQTNQPLHTFFQHNFPSATPPAVGTTSNTVINKLPYDWLVHLDRQLISPVEMLYVSAVKPHELTNVFANAASPFTAQQHLAHWGDNNTRISRLFEVVTTHSRASGVAVGGRIPGKININTIWDQEVFLALCDAQPGNASFYGTAAAPDTKVLPIFNAMLTKRTPNLAKNALTLQDRPFWGLGVGAAPTPDALTSTAGGRGVALTTNQLSLLAPETPLAANTSPVLSNRLLEPVSPIGAIVPPGNEYQRLELLNKIYNNVTTRSNSFAVFLTVGFFEVTDETTRPIKLGAEIGAAEGRNIRHRLFAIVDRTQLTVAPVPYPGPALLAGAIGGFALPKTGGPLAVQDPRTLRWWNVQAGTTVVLEPNTDNEETVTLYQDPNTPAQLSFKVQNPHPAGFAALIRGNPGPMAKYDPRKDSAVVPYFAVID